MTKAEILEQVKQTGPTFECLSLSNKVAELCKWTGIPFGEGKEAGTARIINLIDGMIDYIERH